MTHPQSNAPAGYPDVSSEGYPLFYPIGGDGLPAGPARLYYLGNTFADATELETWKLRARQRDDNLEAWRAAWQAERHWGPLFISGSFGPIGFYVAKLAHDYAVQGRGDLFPKVYAGTNGEIALLKQWISHSMPPDFDAATFAGPDKATIDAIAA